MTAQAALAKTKPPATAPAKAPVIRTLHSGALARAEHKRDVLFITPEHGVTMDDVMDPRYWAHVAARIRPFTQIEVLFDDCSEWALLLVVDCDQTWAKVRKLQHINLNENDAAEIAQIRADSVENDIEVKWKGPSHKFAVIRKSDNVMLKSGHASKEDAAKWIAEYKSNIIS